MNWNTTWTHPISANSFCWSCGLNSSRLVSNLRDRFLKVLITFVWTKKHNLLSTIHTTCRNKVGILHLHLVASLRLSTCTVTDWDFKRARQTFYLKLSITYYYILWLKALKFTFMLLVRDWQYSRRPWLHAECKTLVSTFIMT